MLLTAGQYNVLYYSVPQCRGGCFYSIILTKLVPLSLFYFTQSTNLGFFPPLCISHYPVWAYPSLLHFYFPLVGPPFTYFFFLTCLHLSLGPLQFSGSVSLLFRDLCTSALYAEISLLSSSWCGRCNLPARSVRHFLSRRDLAYRARSVCHFRCIGRPKSRGVS